MSTTCSHGSRGWAVGCPHDPSLSSIASTSKTPTLRGPLPVDSIQRVRTTDGAGMEITFFDGIKSPRRLRNATPVVPDDRTVEVILGAAYIQRDRAVIALLLNGLRAEEVTLLGPDDFVWSPEYGCHIIRVKGKGFKERLVPANSETSREVSAYLSISKRGTPWLLGALRGRSAMTRRQVAEVLRRACKRAGIPEVSPHKLRHHFGTRMYEATENLLALQALMGHESPVTTQVYVRLDLRSVVAAMKKDPRNVRKENNLEDYTNEHTGRRDSSQRPAEAERSVGDVQQGPRYLQ